MNEPDAEVPLHEYTKEVDRLKTDSSDNVCPFCLENGFVTIIGETEVAYLVQVVKNVDGKPVLQVGRYFIIPKQHMESVLERPDDWTVHEKSLLWRALDVAGRDDRLMELMDGRELLDALNLNWNNGEWAGQLVLHPHLWVIFRYDDLKVGMDGMITEISGSRAAVRASVHDGERHDIIL